MLGLAGSDAFNTLTALPATPRFKSARWTQPQQRPFHKNMYSFRAAKKKLVPVP